MIRLGTPDDAEGVARVHVETWQAAYAHALPHQQLQALSMHEGALGDRRRARMIEAGEVELRRLGHRDAVLWVLDDNPRARRFYELAGWSLDGEAREIHIFGFDVAEVRYAKRL